MTSAIDTASAGPKSFEQELTELINRHSMENGSDTPDFLLAAFLCDCLASYEVAVAKREAWYGREMNGPAVPLSGAGRGGSE